MFCKNCGSPIRENSKFCTHCGHSVEQGVTIINPQVVQAIVPTGEMQVEQEMIQAEPFSRTQKWIALGLLGLVVLAAAAYYFFLMPNPKRDGKKAALAICECNKNYYTALDKMYADFQTNFSSYSFTTRLQARNKLNEEESRVYQTKTDCENNIGLKNATLQNKFLNDAKAYSKFDAAYTAAFEGCVSPFKTEFSAGLSQVDMLIASIRDPEPDIEKIKADLIGKNIPGWNFDFLSEFKEAQITNTLKGDGEVNFTCLFQLEGSAADKHECEIDIRYSLSSNGWEPGVMNWHYITYTNTAPVDNWQRVTPLRYCNYTILDNGQKYWVSEGGSQSYKGGPGGEPFNLTSSDIHIRSREDYPVDLVFKYTKQE